MKKNFILIAGNPRSGTTFIGKMLALGSSVQYLDEPFNAEFGMVGVKSYFPYISETNPDDTSLHNKKLVDDFFAGKTKFRKLDPKAATSKKQYVGRKLFGTKNNYQYKNLFYNPAIKTGIIKDPTASLLSSYIANQYNTPVLVIIRHPLATMASLKRLNMKHPLEHLSLQSDFIEDYLAEFLKGVKVNKLSYIEQNALHWLIINNTLQDFANESDNIVFVKHEDLSVDPTGEIKKLYDNYSLKFTNKIANQILLYTSESNPTAAPANKMHHLKRNSKENIDNWKDFLTKKEVAKIKSICYEFSKNYYKDNTWES